MKKHDGWILKMPPLRRMNLLPTFFHVTRSGVTKQIDETVVDGYKKWKKSYGKEYEIVKVKLVEVK